MRALMIRTVAVAALLATPIWADTVTPQLFVEFSPGPTSAGQWHYDGAGVLSFDQSILVDAALGSNYDALAGARVYLPTFQVSGIPDAPYMLTPLGNATVSIRSANGSYTFLEGSLGMGDLTTIGTIAGGYTRFQADISDLFVTHEGNALGSAALAVLQNMKLPSLDFELSLQGGSGPGYYSFAQMLDGGFTGSGGFSGAMTIPEPTTIALLGLGVVGLLRNRQKPI